MKALFFSIGIILFFGTAPQMFAQQKIKNSPPQEEAKPVLAPSLVIKKKNVDPKDIKEPEPILINRTAIPKNNNSADRAERLPSEPVLNRKAVEPKNRN